MEQVRADRIERQASSMIESGKSPGTVGRSKQTGRRRPTATRTATASGRSHATFAMRMGVFELVLASNDSDVAWVEAIVRGEAEFALIEEDAILLLCYRFGEALPWSVAPYRSSRDSEQNSYSTATSELVESRALLAVVLRDAQTGRETTIRNLTLSLDFTRAIRAAVREQGCASADPRAWQRAVERLARSYPNITSMVARCEVRTLGIA